MPEVSLNEEQQRRLHQSRVVDAYKKLFGEDDKTRSAIQRTVWRDLQAAGYANRPVFVPGKDGALCPLKAAFADGRRSIYLYVEANVTADLGAPEQPKK